MEATKLNNWENIKVLVTGASGFKGSWLCATLLNLGATVFGTVKEHRNPLSAYSIFDLDKHIIKINLDITNRQQVYDVLNAVEPDVIFHLAAKALVPVSLRDPRRTFDVNIMGTLNMLEACRKLKVCKKILICSTDHVFGSVKPEDLPKSGFDEEKRVGYGGPYDTSKSAMELIVRSYHYTYWGDLPHICITRCANVFGYGDINQRRVIPLFINSSINYGFIPLKYRNNGHQFIHITDAISGYIRAVYCLDKKTSPQNCMKPDFENFFTPTYHFAVEKYENTDEPYITMESLANLVGEILNSKVDDKNCVAYASNENKVQALNCQKTISALNWEVKKDFKVAIKGLKDWYELIVNKENELLKAYIDKDVAKIINGLN